MASLMLIITIISITLGSSVQFGYHTGVVNEVLDIIGNYTAAVAKARGNPLTPATVQLLQSAIVAVFAVGGLIGGVSAGALAASLGRKGCLLLNNVPSVIGAGLMLMCGWVPSYELLLAGRFLSGIAAGVNTGVAPMYLSEIAPLSIRGAAGTVNQFAIVLAILISQVLGLPFVLGTDDKWHWLLGASLVPSFAQIITLPWLPESPRHLLVTANQQRAARTALGQLRGSCCSSSSDEFVGESAIEEELAEMYREAESGQGQTLSLKQLLFTKHLLHLLLIACGMQITQQFSGINAVINYSNQIFTDAGMAATVATYATLGIGITNLCVTFVSVVLVDRAGRKTLHLTGLGGMCISAAMLTIALVLHSTWKPAVYAAIATIYLYVVFFAIGPGSIPWFITAELFNQAARPTAIGCAVLVNWIGQIAIGLGYPPVLRLLGSYSFVPFVILLALFFLFTWFLVPETKGRSSDELEQLARERTGTLQYEVLPIDAE